MRGLIEKEIALTEFLEVYMLPAAKCVEYELRKADDASHFLSWSLYKFASLRRSQTIRLKRTLTCSFLTTQKPAVLPREYPQ